MVKLGGRWCHVYFHAFFKNIYNNNILIKYTLLYYYLSIFNSLISINCYYYYYNQCYIDITNCVKCIF